MDYADHFIFFQSSIRSVILSRINEKKGLKAAESELSVRKKPEAFRFRPDLIRFSRKRNLLRPAKGQRTRVGRKKGRGKNKKSSCIPCKAVVK